MKCPNCNETLLMTERHQVEIDYCPICRGVWLDKGELDKLISYAADQNKVSAPVYEDRSIRTEQHSDRERSDYRDNYRGDHHNGQHKNQQYPKNKKSFLSDFFDFD
ncbi:hypothetical protein D3C87_1550830 [compost metagenome]